MTERWSTQDKFNIVVETSRFSEIELAEYCRSKGLYVEQVVAWKDACMQANGGVAKEATRLQQELRQKGRELKSMEKALPHKEAALVRRAILSEGLIGSSRPLVLHSDNGSPMKGATLLETLYQLGITPSRSRPRVSNDNPYAESLFRTCKYRPGYPAAGFGDLTQARKWVLAFVLWYNNVHKHNGLNFVKPTQRHTGQDQAVFQARKRLYEKAQLAHSERWSGSTRNWTLEPVVWLNPERSNIEQEKTI